MKSDFSDEEVQAVFAECGEIELYERLVIIQCAIFRGDSMILTFHALPVTNGKGLCDIDFPVEAHKNAKNIESPITAHWYNFERFAQN